MFIPALKRALSFYRIRLQITQDAFSAAAGDLLPLYLDTSAPLSQPDLHSVIIIYPHQYHCHNCYYNRHLPCPSYSDLNVTCYCRLQRELWGI